MQKRFIELVTAFLDESGIECPVIPGENIVAVPLGDFSFNIGLLESRNAIVMQGIAGIVPATGREAFYAELLRMNSLFKGSNGATFGIEDDTVTLQSIIYMEALTQEAFTVQAVTFLEALATALEGFEAVVERSVNAVPESLEDSLISMQNMIRI